MTRSWVRALLAPLERRVLLLAGRAVVRLVDDSRPVQELQLAMLRGELRHGVERLQEVGFSSRPLPGAWAFAVCLGGNRDHPVVIATDDGRHRPTDLEPGEVALYDPAGQLVHLKADGSVLIRATGTLRVTAPTSAVIEAPSTTCTGNLFVQGAVLATGDVFAFQGLPELASVGVLRDTYNAHNHNENDNAPAPTGPPNTQA